MESSRATLPYDNRSASGTSYESYLLIAQHVREQIRARELDPYTSRDEVVSIIEASVADYDRRMLRASLPVLHDAAVAVAAGGAGSAHAGRVVGDAGKVLARRKLSLDKILEDLA